MASKRKGCIPSRLDEVKRCCTSWNMEDGPLPVEVKTPLPRRRSSSRAGGDSSTSRPNICFIDLTTEITKVPVHSNEHIPKETKPAEIYSPHLRWPFAVVKVEKFTNKSLYFADEKHGPIIGQLVFDCNDVVSMKETLLQLEERLKSGKASLDLEVYNEKSSGYLEARVVQHSWKQKTDCAKPGRSKTIWKGFLLSSGQLMRSLRYLVDQTTLRLVLCFEEKDGEIKFEFYIELLALLEEDKVLVSEEARKSTHFHFLMCNFYATLKDVSCQRHNNRMHYTGEEIQNLYDYVKKYDSKEWERTVAMSNDEDSRSSSENSSVPLLENSVPLLEQVDDSNQENTSDERNLLEKESFEDESINQSDSCLQECDLDELLVEPASKVGNQFLLPTLRHYQQAAVKWMIAKENSDDYETGIYETGICVMF